MSFVKKFRQGWYVFSLLSMFILALVSAYAFAEVCNKNVKSSNRKCESYQNDSCSKHGVDCPDGSEGIYPGSDSNSYYFGTTYTGNKNDHAKKTGEVTCGYVYNCKPVMNGCGKGDQAMEPDPSQEYGWKAIVRSYPTYGSGSCTPEE